MLGFKRFFGVSLVATFLLVPTGGATASGEHGETSRSSLADVLNSLVTIKEGKDISLQITQSTAKGAFVMKVI